MKKVFVLLFSLGIVAAASAQYGHYDYGRPDVRVGVRVGPDYRYDRFSYERRVAEINREFDTRIWNVQRNPFMSRHEKRKAIRELNWQRDQRLRELRRF